MKKILIIEDDTSTRKFYRHFFERFKNIYTYEAGNSSSGVQIAKNAKPDLIILDNRMPDLPGEQVAKTIKSNQQTKDIPIIMITAMRMTKEQINIIKFDVDDFMEKPFSQWELQHKIEKFLGPLSEITIE